MSIRIYGMLHLTFLNPYYSFSDESLYGFSKEVLAVNHFLLFREKNRKHIST